MSVIFSKSCEYATQATLFIARSGEDKPVLLRDISEGLRIPHHFLSKVLQQLSRSGIVVSHKGSNGGYTLGRPGNEITLGEIIKAIDGEAFLEECVLGFPNCGDENPCPVHDQWKPAKKLILEMLSRRRVSELSKGMDGKLESIEKLTKLF